MTTQKERLDNVEKKVKKLEKDIPAMAVSIKKSVFEDADALMIVGAAKGACKVVTAPFKGAAYLGRQAWRGTKATGRGLAFAGSGVARVARLPGKKAPSPAKG